MNSTQATISMMLTENTGSHMLDSGGAYGRNWERNQGRKFDSEPRSTVTFRVYNDSLEIEVTHNVYHWLSEKATYDSRMTGRFTKFANKPENEYKGWLEIMEDFVDYLAEKHDARKHFSCNTYNGEDLLSQTLQYIEFEMNNQHYALLQIHGGCDVRGGYTKPRVFEIDEYGLAHNADATLYEKDGEWSWYTDDGYHYYSNSYSVGPSLFEKQGWRDSPKLDSIPVTKDQNLIGDGVHIVVTEDGKAYSPNGKQILSDF